MSKTVVALYDDTASARQVLTELSALDNSEDRFWISGDKADTTRFSDLSAGLSSPGSRVGSLTARGVPEDDAHAYAEGVRRGGTLLVGEVDDDHLPRVLDVIERSDMVDLEERRSRYAESGWSRYDARSDWTAEQSEEERARYRGTGLGAAAAGLRDANLGTAATGTTAGLPGTSATDRVGTDRVESATGEETAIPIVEERLDIGKRAVEGGRVRVRTYTVETPVEETVRLRQERVEVERRPVDRPAGDVPADAFRERTIEVSETAEEAVVGKEARVVEEVVVRKDVTEQAETVRDTVRRTEVEVDDDRDRVADSARDQVRGTPPGTERTDV